MDIVKAFSEKLYFENLNEDAPSAHREISDQNFAERGRKQVIIIMKSKNREMQIGYGAFWHLRAKTRVVLKQKFLYSAFELLTSN